jgi:hypothetical protein
MSEPMKIWLVRRIDARAGEGFDEAQGFVVRSRSADSARCYVADECGGRGTCDLEGSEEIFVHGARRDGPARYPFAGLQRGLRR